MTLGPGPSGKGPAAFRTISEASAELGVPQHVLRFWETRFAFIRPTKRAGGRRFYRPQDLAVLRGVRALLQEEGYTIKGVQKLHKEQGLKRLVAASGLDAAAASRLADDVEAAAEAQERAETEPEAERGPERGSEAAERPRESGGEEPRDLETGDLFGAPPSEPPPPAPPSLERSRSVLDASARARLAEVLSDLEATKAGIDALLRG